MNFDDNNHEPDSGADDGLATGRRNFLALLPLGALAGIAGTLAVGAQRALKPQEATRAALEKWTAVGKLAELNGEEPLLRNIIVERQAGWAVTTEARSVFVLPQDNHKVVSSACPHEGCPVVWDKEAKGFLCPCHDSRFSATGAHLSGPSNGDMQQLPSKVDDGVLHVKLA